MSLNFTAIDFETANRRSASACAVGLVKVGDGSIVDRASWLIRPRPPFDGFDPMNIRVHGIRPEDVATAPDWAEQFSDMLDFIDGDVAVAHNAGFDMRVIAAACHETVLPTPKLRSLCSMQVARKTYDLKSYRLPVAAAAAGFPEFTHHDALADSEAAAAIVLDAARRNNAGTVGVLAKTLGLKLARLKAIPLKL